MTADAAGFELWTNEIHRSDFVIVVAGEVDLYTAPELKSELLRLAAEGARRVIVDLTATTFIDSTTLGVLLGAARRLRLLDAELVIVCSDRNIRKILAITLLDRVFTIYDTLSEALAVPLGAGR